MALSQRCDLYGGKVIIPPDISPFQRKPPSAPTTPAPPVQVCEQGWIRFKRDCYYLSDNRLSWPAALVRCRKMGGHLARIYTTGENRFIQNTVRHRRGRYDGYWLGGSDIRNEGIWEWHETRKMIGPVFWHKSEPNSFTGDQDCLQLYLHHNYQWDDELCSNRRHYICEKPVKWEK